MKPVEGIVKGCVYQNSHKEKTGKSVDQAKRSLLDLRSLSGTSKWGNQEKVLGPPLVVLRYCQAGAGGMG